MAEESKMPATLEDVVLARISPIIAELLPEEQLRAQVQMAIYQFTKSRDDSYGRSKPSVLQEMLETELHERFRKIMLDELAKPEYREHWDNGVTQAGPATKKIIEDLVPLLVTAAFSGVVNTTLQALRNQLQSGRLI